MKQRLLFALLLVGATVLGATALREPIAHAAQVINANIVGPLDGQGNLMVHEQGTAAVKLDRDGNVVRVASSASAPVQVQDLNTPSIEPWQREGSSGALSLTIPAGRLGVVDYVSGSCFGGSRVEDAVVMAGVKVTTTEDGNTVTHFVPSAYQHANTTFNAIGGTGEMVRLYADGGTVVEAQAVGLSPCEVHLSGHLEG